MKTLQKGEQFLVQNKAGDTIMYKVFDVLNSSLGGVSRVHFRQKSAWMTDEEWDS
jgi:hypothetical protein